MTKQQIWDKLLRERCHCYPDAVGNMPCDNGAICDRCSSDEIDQEYKRLLKENGYDN